MVSAGDALLASSFVCGGPIRGASRRGLAIDGTRWYTRQLVRELMLDRHVMDGGSCNTPFPKNHNLIDKSE